MVGSAQVLRNVSENCDGVEDPELSSLENRISWPLGNVLTSSEEQLQSVFRDPIREIAMAGVHDAAYRTLGAAGSRAPLALG